jgi:hypothetical protein
MTDDAAIRWDTGPSLGRPPMPRLELMKHADLAKEFSEHSHNLWKSTLYHE